MSRDSGNQTHRNGRLRLARREIRRHGPGNIVKVCWKQWRTERELARRGIVFRSSDPLAVRAAYSAMSEREFQDVNGRQNWANWRTIPSALSGLLPDRPLFVIDLGCGAGDSTRVLACCAPAGSRILGYEVAEPLLEIARCRSFSNRHGEPISVDFRNQPITETFREPNGERLPPGCVDLVNASGVVGQHLDRESAQRLALEVRRVLKSDGLAVLDAGPSLPPRALTAVMREAGFRRVRYRRSSLFDLTGQVVFRPDSAMIPVESLVSRSRAAAQRVLEPLFARNT
ncbi:MAG: class I SAM-dependent methyltransferase [Planctomycetaceae bacterium]